MGLPVPEKADVQYVGEFKPTMYGFNGFKKGVKPVDYALDAKPRADAASAASSRLALNEGDRVAILGNALHHSDKPAFPRGAWCRNRP